MNKFNLLLRYFLHKIDWFLFYFNYGKRKNLTFFIKNYRQNNKTKRCVIVGNGPSLDIKDLERIKDAHFFAFNKIYLLQNQSPWRPNFYMCEDLLVLKQNSNEIRSYVKNNKLLDASFIAFYRGINLKVNELKSCYEFNYVTPSNYKILNFSNDPAKEIFCGYSVTYSALQLAIALGYEEILFIGMDFNFDIKSKSNNEILKGEGEINHFHKDYRKPGELWNQPKLEQQKISFDNAAKFIAKKYKNIKVLNITRGGYFQSFDREKIENFF